MRMSGLAKFNNKMAKENSKAQIEKRNKAEERYKPRICCKKCKETKKTLYKIKNNYYCIDCKVKMKN